MSATTCGFPGCGRAVEALGLCHSHYRQKQRGRPLRALRTGPPGVKLPGVTVSPETAEVLQRLVHPEPYSATKTAVEAYAAAVKARETTGGKGGGP